MKLQCFKIGNVEVLVNDQQIEKAGGLEQAAKKLYSEMFPEPVKPEKVKQ